MENYDHVISSLPIYKAAIHDDFDSVSEIFDRNPELMTNPMTPWKETPLGIAVGTNRSPNFVEKLLERLVASGEVHKILHSANNALHVAGECGNPSAAKLLVDALPFMAQIPNGNVTAMSMAALRGNKKTLRYLLTVTKDEGWNTLDDGPYDGVPGGDLITRTISAELYDVALEIIDSHPKVVLQKDRHGQTALQILAMKPDIFPSGSCRQLGFWGRFLYSLMPVAKSQVGASNVNIFLRNFNKFTDGFWNALKYVAPGVKNIHEIKEKHRLGSLLVKRICEIVIATGNHDIAWKILGSAIPTAVLYGTHELIEECIITYPCIIWYAVDKWSWFFAAIKERQERVYNIVFQLSRHVVWLGRDYVDGDNNALHIAAMLAPSHRLNAVTGAALQMQRELQWFKEVERFIEPSYRENRNIDDKTPRMVFTESHENLLEKGQQWMKDTASSCTVVAALIVTMAFAAAFTVPGGNQNDGIPLFLNDSTFMLFVVSDAIALFSSATSVLMFLGILTSRYAEGDFLYALPKRLTIGLLSLFLSLATTMVAFSATLALMLQDKVTWIAAPLIIATSIPVCLFGVLQFPLLVELVYSTYGRSIFHQQNDLRLY